MLNELQVLTLIAVTLCSCRGTGGSAAAGTAGGDVVHPRKEFFHRPIPVHSRVDLGAAAAEDHPLFRVLSAARRSAVVGVLEGPREQMFGKVSDVVVDSSNSIYVLDSYSHAVRVFGRDGQYIASVGAAGRGPGEFVEPRRLAMGQDGALYVLDVYHVHKFIHDGAGFRFERSFSYDFEPIDVCVLPSGLFIHGTTFAPGGAAFKAPPLIHRVSGERVEASFGQVYNAPDAMVAVHVNRSLLACDRDPDRLVLAPMALLGEFHAYGTDGTPEWITVVDGFRPIYFARTARGTRTRIPEDGYDHTYSLVPVRPWPPGVTRPFFLAQIAYVSREDADARNELTELRTFAIGAQDGRIVALGRGFPRIVAFGDGFFVSLREDPFPRIEIYEWGTRSS